MKQDPVSVGLSWQGKDLAFRARPGAAPCSVREAEQGRGKLVQGDNRQALSELAGELREQVTLAYLDPPFLTGRAHEAIVKDPAVRAKDRGGPLKARPRTFAFDDCWSSRAMVGTTGKAAITLRVFAETVGRPRSGNVRDRGARSHRDPLLPFAAAWSTKAGVAD